MIIAFDKNPTTPRINTATGTGYYADMDEKTVYFTRDGKVYDKVDFEKELGKDADFDNIIHDYIQWLDSIHGVKFAPSHIIDHAK